MVPDVPLVEGEIDLLFAVFLSLHRIADGYYALDKVIHIHRPGEEARRVAGRVGIVAVQGDIVDVLIALVQHRELPVAETRHLRTGRAAGHELDGRIDPLHHLGGLVRSTAVFIGGFLPHLPGTVHLVAEAPELDVEWLFLSIRDTLVGEIAVSRVIGIFHDVPRLLRAAGAEIHRVHDLAPGLLRPAGEFVEAYLVGLGREPREVQSFRALFNRADAVFPAEPRDEVSARIPHQGHAQLPYGLHDVGAETQFVGQRMARFIDTAINRPSQVLDKGAEQPSVDPGNLIIPVQNYARLFHLLILSHCRRSGRR